MMIIIRGGSKRYDYIHDWKVRLGGVKIRQT